MTCAGSCMELEIIIPTEVTRMLKDKCIMISRLWMLDLNLLI